MAPGPRCMPPDFRARPPWPFPISRAVAGRWSGILYGRPGGQRGEDWVEFAVHADGTYTLASARTIGVFEGSGRVSLADGRLIAEGEKARATFTLYQRDHKRFLRVDGSMASGQRLQAVSIRPHSARQLRGWHAAYASADICWPQALVFCATGMRSPAAYTPTG